MTENISSNVIDRTPNSIDSIINPVTTSAYIHIPFCRRRCYYCDFPISVMGEKTRSTMVEEYIAALIKDIQLTASTYQPLKTVFFGGGTPSLLSPQQLSRIIKAIAFRFGIAKDAEISMEIDPGTFNRDRLLGYLEAGLNRFSLGVQTFDEELLKICGRSHTLTDVMQAIEIIKQLNIDNFSLDLISGLPHQTLKQSKTSLDTAIAIAPKHLSCYDLVLEPVTAFGKQYQPGKTPLPDDEATAEMYRLTQKTLTATGYEHYEVSNYALPGYQCQHNRIYWKNQPYYGFGMGAASYVSGQRFSRPRTRREYYAWLKDGAIVDAPQTSETDYILETLMLGLRLADGVDLTQFDRYTVEKIWSCLKPYRDRGWIEVVGNDAETVRLSDPEGFLFSNTILAALFEKLE